VIFISASNFQLPAEWYGILQLSQNWVYMVLGNALTALKMFVWILNHKCFKACNVVSVHPKSIKPGQHDLSCDGVNLSIGVSLKIVPVPYAILEWLLCLDLADLLLNDCLPFVNQ